MLPVEGEERRKGVRAGGENGWKDELNHES